MIRELFIYVCSMWRERNLFFEEKMRSFNNFIEHLQYIAKITNIQKFKTTLCNRVLQKNNKQNPQSILSKIQKFMVLLTATQKVQNNFRVKIFIVKFSYSEKFKFS
jgi:hypothetical protein